jgi:histidinol-phosphate/aromatic aminotransferase/cobyric acid decarboxylase-like protein
MQLSLSKSPQIRLYPSVANFFLIELCNTQMGAAETVKRLRSENIFLRNCDSMSEQFRNNFLRIAVKDNISNEKIVNALLKTLMVHQSELAKCALG